MEKPLPRILVIEDDAATAEEVCRTLSGAGLAADHAATLADGVAQAERDRYGLVVLDRMRPGRGGLAIIDRVRGPRGRTGVLVLSALGRPGNRAEGLDRGADDSLSKPFDPEELIARVRAVMRRLAASPSADLMALGDIEIHL